MCESNEYSDANFAMTEQFWWDGYTVEENFLTIKSGFQDESLYLARWSNQYTTTDLFEDELYYTDIWSKSE